MFGDIFYYVAYIIRLFLNIHYLNIMPILNHGPCPRKLMSKFNFYIEVIIFFLLI